MGPSLVIGYLKSINKVALQLDITNLFYSLKTLMHIIATTCTILSRKKQRAFVILFWIFFIFFFIYSNLGCALCRGCFELDFLKFSLTCSVGSILFVSVVLSFGLSQLVVNITIIKGIVSFFLFTEMPRANSLAVCI